MTNRYILLMFFFAVVVSIYGQVGINTKNPKASLDVDGAIRVRKQILLGGDDNAAGSSGLDGQFVVSEGAGAAPKWNQVELPTPINGEYVLKSTVALSDDNGFILNNMSGTDPYKKDLRMPLRWNEFDDLRLVLDASAKEQRVVLSFQTVIQSDLIGGDNASWQSYAVGIYVDDALDLPRLKAVRKEALVGNNYPQKVVTLFCTLDDLPLNKKNTIRVAFTRRATSNNMNGNKSAELYVGCALSTVGVAEVFLNKSTLRVDVFEKVK